MSKHIIAGIDPGATIGIAILNLSGQKIATLSANNGIGEAVAIIEQHGTPSLIACDKMPAPEMVQKAASYFSCRLYTPQRNIREEEKRQVAHGADVANNHERDAYTAAVFGFRFYANKLRQIDALPDLQHGEKEKIKHLLLRGYRIKDAFASLETEGDAALERKPADAGRPLHQEHALPAEELRERVSSLARENANLRLLIERLEEEKGQLSERLSLLQNDYRRSLLQDSELRHLKHQLHLSLERLSWRKKRKGQPKPMGSMPGETGQQSVRQQEGHPLGRQERGHFPKQDGASPKNAHPLPQKKMQEDINVEEDKLDIEKLVMEYRKGRNTGKR